MRGKRGEPTPRSPDVGLAPPSVAPSLAGEPSTAGTAPSPAGVAPSTSSRRKGSTFGVPTMLRVSRAKKASYSSIQPLVSGFVFASFHSLSYSAFASSSIWPLGNERKRMFHSLLQVSAFWVRFELPMMIVEI